MDLKEFIKGTISSISYAIVESQTELEEQGVIVNPEKTEIGKTGQKLLRSNGWRYVQELHFDVSVGVEERNGNNGKGELQVAGIISIGGGTSESNLNKFQNRISFSIPIAFSTTPTPKEYASNRQINK